ncbi:DUF501 domain-containing protein [Pokkaliibacter sp. MBI-7]|uniref:DUF501 domain-containing protein n=1 Tax=Pokkaliibacter sp. MBI-7 TaxID=3040600 RepID=UPI00244C5578|nr:DUF501 domain-containing protein [Pokkaliibacter sp. MBI-7]MDH2433285.1 DUF501 domain-containing protein [Pokkaliibacter sp. MBI-7]
MITETQLDWLTRQLERAPRGLEDIAASSATGIPLVVRMRAVMEGKPFPTLYWLTSRDLFKTISTIEAGGYIKRLEAEVQDNPELKAALHASHQDYVDQRNGFMREEDRELLATQGKLEYLQKLGVGGIADWDRVRCLHMHYAHHLCGYNVIGQRLEAEFQLSQLVIQF